MTTFAEVQGVVVTISAARGPIGLEVIPPIVPGQYLVWNAEREVQGSAGTGADAGLRTDLAADNGGSNVGYKRPEAGAVTLGIDTMFDNREPIPEDFGTFDGEAANVTEYKAFLSAQERNIDTPIDRNVPMPKLHLTSSYASGKLFNGLPAAVRYNGKDYIIVREGNDHLETVPITNTSRLACYVRDVNGVEPESRAIIYNPAGVDPRDPNILRDGSGNAILVGGKFKVVGFEWAGNYNPGSASAKVWDLDPTNLAAGLTGAVTLPAPIVGVKSDIRQLASGTYAFIGYTQASDCYLVTTTNWSSFTTELIGPGNEAAFCETTEDTTLNVVVRAEEVYGNKCSIFYKRAAAGGSWRVHKVLPFTLNAPTFVKVQNYRVISIAPGGGDGWLLFGRDKTGRQALSAFDAPISQLVVYRCKENYGREIDVFTDRVVLMGVPQPSAPGLAGDAHYCSVIAGQYSGQLQIYTYGEFITSFDNNAGTSLRVATWRIEAFSDGDLGIRTIKPQRKNLIRNSHFAQGEAGIDGTSANAAVVVDSITGRNVFRISDKITTQIPYVMVDCLKGDTLFPKITTRLNFSDLAGSGRHVTLVLRDGVTNTVIQTESPALNPADFFGVARTIVCRPVRPTSNKLKMEISTITDAGLTDAESDIFHIELSDDCTRDPLQGDPMPTLVKMSPVGVPVVFGVTAGGASSDATYSAGFWAIFGDVKANGIPLEATDYSKLSVRLENCTTNAGAVKVRCTRILVNSDGTLAASFTTESGVLTASVSCRAIIEIAQ